MNHDNRGRITIKIGEGWQAYSDEIPDGSQALGIVTRGNKIGALVRLEDGKYAQVIAGTVYKIDGRKIAHALGHSPGRPIEVQNGRRVNVYLDEKSIAIAEKIGDGNVSEGIRKSLQKTGDQDL